MRVVVTGATGFLGSELVRFLVAARHDVHVFARYESKLNSLAEVQTKITIHHIEESVEWATAALRVAAPEIVIHVASLFLAEHKPEQVRPLIESNIVFPAILIEAMGRLGVRKFINCSTSWQHYEDRDYSPVCLYAATKQAFLSLLQFYCESVDVSVVDLVLFDTYGPRDKRQKLLSLLYRASLAASEPVAFSPGDQELDLVYVDDVINAFAHAIDLIAVAKPGIRSYAVRSGQSVRLRTLVELFSEITGLSPKIDWGRRPYRAREVMRPWRGGELLPNWRAEVSLKEGLRRLHEYNVQGY